MGTMKWIRSFALFGFVACQEYNIDDNAPQYDQSLPPTLDNPIQRDRIVQITTPLVDVLWVVDNSESMLNEQSALADNFPAFMDYFLNSGLDYHIGVVSTDMVNPNESGRLIEASTGERYISLETEEPMVTFAEIAQLGANGDGTERGRDAAYTALELLKDSYNTGFLRNDELSGVHVMIVTDEQDWSNASLITKEEFAVYLNDLRIDEELVSFNSICMPPNVPINGGDEYVYVTEEVGGILHDIREDDWVNVLDTLGMQAAGLKSEFFLSKLPVVSTIEVQVHDPDGNVIPFENTEYTYSLKRNSINFNTFVPTPLSEVYIEYTILSAVADTE